MKKLILPVLFSGIAIASFAQASKDRLAEIKALKQARLDTIVSLLVIKPGDIVADIGSGNGYNLVRLSKYYPPVRYYAQDIDSARCNRTNFVKTIALFNPTMPIDSFTFIYGTVTATHLPPKHFTKVLLTAVIHEFDYKEAMFTDIKSILRPGGEIFIEEPLVLKKAPKDKGCNNPYLTEPELKKILADNGIEIGKEKYIRDSGNNQYRKVFQCRVKL